MVQILRVYDTQNEKRQTPPTISGPNRKWLDNLILASLNHHFPAIHLKLFLLQTIITFVVFFHLFLLPQLGVRDLKP